MDSPDDKPKVTDRSFGAWLRDMPRWKKIALGAAVATIVVGGVLTLVSPGTPAPGPAGAGPGGPTDLTAQLVQGGTGGTGTGTGGTQPAAEEPAAKGVFRLGFSFVVGFCIGSFIRATLKIASIAFGFWLTMTVVLSYYGLVVVDWQALDQVWNRFTTNVENEWGSFQTFMTGSLPAAGLAIAGLATGLKRH